MCFSYKIDVHTCIVQWSILGLGQQLRLNKNKLPHEPFLKKPPFRQSPGWPGQLCHPGGQISKARTLLALLGFKIERALDWKCCMQVKHVV